MLFMTILSTDLKALKRRGYNGAPSLSLSYRLKSSSGDRHLSHSPLVDRILRQQKAEREAAEKASRAENRASLISNSSEMTLQDKPPTTQTKNLSTPSLPPNTGGTGLEQMLKRPSPMSAINELGRLLRPNRTDAPSRSTSPPRGEDTVSSSNPGALRREISPPPQLNIPGDALVPLSANPGPSRPLVRSPQPGPHVTPLSNIGTLRV